MPRGVYFRTKYSWNKGLTKSTDPRVANGGRTKGCTTWNKGLTKEQFPCLANGGVKKGTEPWNKGLSGVQVNPMKGRKHSLVSRDIMSKSIKECWKDLVYAKRISDTAKKLWQDPEHAKKCLHRRIPSYPEQIFIDLCKEFRYVGNGTLIIGGKNPDFVCVTDEHKLIEIWGDYFHKGQNPQDRIDFFKSRGYDCIIIWASELKHLDSVMTKVNKFVDAS